MHNHNLPLVSIIIPVFNGSKYLEEAIKSAINQTYSNIEILVINDGSNDDGATAAIANKFLGRITYYEKLNGGVSSALNFGIQKMKGDFFSWLSHDDVYFPNKIENQVSFIKNTGFFGMIHSNFNFVDSKGELLNNANDFYKFKHVDFLTRLFLCYPIGGITTLIPKKIIDEIGLFDTKLITCQDYDYWIRIGKKFNVIDVDFVAASSRIHSLQGTKTIKSMRSECDVFYLRNLKELATIGRIHESNFKSINTFLLSNYYFKSSYWLFMNYKVMSIPSLILFLKQAIKFSIKSIIRLSLSPS